MAKDFVPPKTSQQPSASEGSSRTSNSTRAASPDSDDDITRLVGSFSTPSQSNASSSFVQTRPNQDPFAGPRTAGSFNRGGFTQHPTFGRPSKMMSSLKQKAGVLIKQKHHPEHHRDATSVFTPRPQKYADRKAPPMPVFDSNSNDPYAPKPRSTATSFGDNEVFYTDPTKANEDLKALLEGGMESDEEEDAPVTEAAKGAETKDAEPKPAGKGKVSRDGTVDGLKVQLLPHQVEGVEWMRGRELGPVKRGKVPKGGILADDMGLGKTLQTVSLILTQQKPNKDEKGWKKQFENAHKGTLVVAPLALIRQWEFEINEKVDKSHGLRVLVHHGPSRTKDFRDLMKYDVVITTFQILVSEHGHTNDKVQAGCFGLHWWRVVLDEAHTIKNRNAKMTKACYALRSEYRWCLTGTPMQNNLEELQSLIKFLQIAPYSDLKHWKEHIDRPFKEGKGHIAIQRLHSLLRCFMKRRTKAILKEEGALNPGGKPTAEGETSKTGFKVTERKVMTIAAKLAPAERRFYDNLETRANENMQNIMKEGGQKYTHAFTLLLRLRQACNHPKLVIGKLDKDAMSTGGGGPAESQTTSQQDAAVDGLADLLGGMSIEKKRCSVCGKTVEALAGNSEMCKDCSADLEAFNADTPERKKSRRKSLVRKIEKKKLKPQKQQRRPRNRNAIVDSDDEEEEGSWLVPEGERGELDLGRAGGSEDENAEGGGDDIGSEDSDEEGRTQNHRDLSSFVVDDEAPNGEGKPDIVELDSDTESDTSLESISALTSKMASQTLEDKKSPAKDKKSSKKSVTSSRSSAYESDEGSSTDSDGVDASSIYGSDADHFTSSSDPTRVLASAKVSELLRLLHAEAHEHKFIVFSQFTTMLDLVQPFLRREGFRFARYDGSMKNDDREESLRRLRQEASCRVLLCSLKCGSLGLNLTAATRVIIVEPFWNPFVEEQAIDRVHRLTQKIDVVVYKLTVSETVEERIIELQEKKRLLAEQTIEGAGGKGKKDALKLGLNDIMNLFRPQGIIDSADGPPQGAREGMSGMMKRRPEAARPAQMQRQGSGAYDRRW